MPGMVRAGARRAVIDDGRGRKATIAHMSTVASRDLRNHTAEVLRQVADGTILTITVNGAPVAELGPARSTRRTFATRAELVDLISHHQADSGLTADLQGLAGESTDDRDLS